MANILVVDDSSSMRQMVAFTFKSDGYQVSEAADGQAGLQLAEKTAFDLVISDVNMLVMNGLELTAGIRKKSACQRAPILLLTTESSAEQKLAGNTAGATGWLIKPFNPQALQQTVGKVIR
jgi:two-component system chemotaxis response regulator CheY